ncbi:hypothetical protein FGU65_03200 [Methanoculleus sp. FWC-SCC1]|uniref:Uncharacterized protein n=1 Tax=Methanoculleus frigidifontis TaxID=2584085 RepID=A0ABT8M7J8_9EURY|nr:hypothetical protein [Methanoculleus sp. FWC-SCC1]MDN7023908.1 hypothetical protein [Methanoculleus sp. FWC-SCC1]
MVFGILKYRIRGEGGRGACPLLHAIAALVPGIGEMGLRRHDLSITCTRSPLEHYPAMGSAPAYT